MDPTGLAKVIAGALRPLYLRLQAVERVVGVAPQTSSLQPTPDKGSSTSSPKPRVRLAGDWLATKQYGIDDAVVFGGRLFRATTNVIGLRPDEGAVGSGCWQPIDERRSGGAA
jgi:hypothetical protein